MRYTITFSARLYADLTKHLNASRTEAAAYLLCRRSISDQEIRLLPKKFIPVLDKEIISSSRTHMSIQSASFRAAMKEADALKCSFLFVHSHPDGPNGHSPQDDKEEATLFRTAYNRISNSGPHGSIVITGAGDVTGRVWLPDGSTAEIALTRILGNKFRFLHRGSAEVLANHFDRHVRAFGPDLQPVLSRLHVGIIGAGGTGSSVAEQLIRLGIGELTVVDGGSLEGTNVTRGYGSGISDVGTKKAVITGRLAKKVGLGTEVRVLTKNCTHLSTLKSLRDCDLIFGCTDDQWGRALLNRLAIYYLIPVFDMGVKIDSKDGQITSIQGRVTTLLPGMACLSCRGRISAEQVRQESLSAVSPNEADSLRKEGYIPALEGPAASMIAFTTSIAATAVIELLHRLTQLGGVDRTATEVLQLFDQSRMRTNSTPPQSESCICSEETFVARGDCEPLLDSTWRPE